MKKPSTAKLTWQGRILGVQPRIHLLRSFDERTHSYLGYVLRIEGNELLSNLVYSCLGRTLRMIFYSFAILEFHSLDHIGQ